MTVFDGYCVHTDVARKLANKINGARKDEKHKGFGSFYFIRSRIASSRYPLLYLSFEYVPREEMKEKESKSKNKNVYVIRLRGSENALP
jgi:hypothetical protein